MSAQAASSFDLVTLSILNHAFVAVCREMGVTLMKTSYSTIFNEALDFTCALAFPDGEMFACAEFCPAQIGAMPVIIHNIAREIPLDEWEPGDVVIHNDPYRGGCHIPEHTVVKPIFGPDGEFLAMAVSIGHIAEVGGKAPAAFCGDATDIFQEGLRIPPIKIKKRGRDVEEVWKIMLANVRTPRFNYGDLRALIASIDLGEQRFLELVGKYGMATIKGAGKELLDYSERLMRAEITAIPDGVYGFEDYLEDDGIENRPYKIKVTCYVRGDEIVVDFTGSDQQAKGPINATFGVTHSATYNALLHLTDPAIPKNSGCYRPVRIVAPPGTVVNVDYPGPEVGGNTEAHPRIALTVIGALAKAVPERAMACEGGTHINFVFGGFHPDNGEYYACYDLEAVGWGARPYADGNNFVDSINGNCRVSPVEVFETRFPWLVEEFRLRENSGGPGKYRGGLGATKTYRARAEITASQLTDRHKLGAWGLFGGQEGARGATLVQVEGRGSWQTIPEAFGRVSTSKYSNVTFRPGDRVRLITPGGGGWGDPRERAQDLIKEDLSEGFITAEHAREQYGIDEEER
jgi:N-methylhydantoinase B/oxoprolinase/acetone carboxylase alpha subunit